jgi:hypothetical protein
MKKTSLGGIFVVALYRSPYDLYQRKRTETRYQKTSRQCQDEIRKFSPYQCPEESHRFSASSYLSVANRSLGIASIVTSPVG